MAKKVTRIKAGESSSKTKEDEAPVTKKKVVVKDKKLEKTKAKKVEEKIKAEKKAEKVKIKDAEKKTFVVFRQPKVLLIAFSRRTRLKYRQVRRVGFPFP